jgi:hypothetical protein
MENDSEPDGFAGLIEKIKRWNAPFSRSLLLKNHTVRMALNPQA